MHSCIYFVQALKTLELFGGSKPLGMLLNSGNTPNIQAQCTLHLIYCCGLVSIFRLHSFLFSVLHVNQCRSATTPYISQQGKFVYTAKLLSYHLRASTNSQHAGDKNNKQTLKNKKCWGGGGTVIERVSCESVWPNHATKV